jgi:hypothetical protein
MHLEREAVQGAETAETLGDVYQFEHDVTSPDPGWPDLCSPARFDLVASSSSGKSILSSYLIPAREFAEFFLPTFASRRPPGAQARGT